MKTEPSRVQRSRLFRLFLAVLVTAPLAFSAVYMWVMWDPTKLVNQMPVAIVNEDKPFGEGDDRVNAGAEVTNNLLQSQALGFEATDERTAMAGLASGHYYFVIKIPQTFSTTLALIGKTTNAPALITVVYNDNNTIKASQIGDVAMSRINAAVLEGVSSQTVGKMVDGVDKIGSGLNKAADGSGQLADGLVKLQAGTDQLGDGATQVADGIDQLVGWANSPPMIALVQQLKAMPVQPPGVKELVDLLDGLQRLQAGSREIANQLTDPNKEYRSGVNQLVDGSARLHTGLADGAKQVPDLSDTQKRESLAKLLSTPVKGDDVFLARAQFSGPGGEPLMLELASLLAVIVVFMSFRAQRYLTGKDAPLTVREVLHRARAVSLISLVSVGVVGSAVWMSLTPHPNPHSYLAVVAVTAVATLMNVALVSILFTVFGYAGGALTALSLGMLQLFSFGGVWMVETLPAPFQWLHLISPMTVVRHGMIAAFNGAPGLATSLVAMSAIAVAAAAVNVAAVRTVRRRHEARVSELAADGTAQGEVVVVG
ncbi:YhgE/Pip family protein [Smaragdicoccus niigatensis]|uniref:YhgE/Pip family protein n=1 Tax=Smaragdicoccus niigatensis TaxID=359359 RepID=UPI00037DB029|nr:YhgE/Pip family protein [Smaragdicoccus niigatensis]